MREILLQDVVVPVCAYEMDGSKVRIKQHFGTAFFIDKQGVFLTAGHVIKKIPANLKFGLCVKDRFTLNNLMVEISNIVYASDNIDVAIGKIEYQTVNWFELPEKGASEWLDVATFGYPQSALDVGIDSFHIHLRVFKGYVQRLISPTVKLAMGEHKNIIELSFPIPLALSGSPLFMANKPKPALLGICIGSNTSESVEYEGNEPEIEKHGLVQDIFDILDWEPSLLNGKSIKDVIFSK